jgi:hypothetical protein
MATNLSSCVNLDGQTREKKLFASILYTHLHAEIASNLAFNLGDRDWKEAIKARRQTRGVHIYQREASILART